MCKFMRLYEYKGNVYCCRNSNTSHLLGHCLISPVARYQIVCNKIEQKLSHKQTYFKEQKRWEKSYVLHLKSRYYTQNKNLLHSGLLKGTQLSTYTVTRSCEFPTSPVRPHNLFHLGPLTFKGLFSLSWGFHCHTFFLIIGSQCYQHHHYYYDFFLWQLLHCCMLWSLLLTILTHYCYQYQHYYRRGETWQPC